MYRNDNEKAMNEYPLIRIFANTTIYEYHSPNINKVLKWLKNKTIQYFKPKGETVVSLYIFFNTRLEFNKYKDELTGVINYEVK